MELSAIQNVLSGIVDLSAGKVTRSRGQEWQMIPCPFASKLHKNGTDNNLSFGVSTGTPSFFHCFSCGSKGPFSRFFDILSEINGVDYSSLSDSIRLADRETVESIFNNISRFKVEEQVTLDDSALFWPSAKESIEALAYLEKRKILDFIDFYDIRWDESKSMIVMPVRTPMLVGAYGRSVQGRRHHNYFGMLTNYCLGGYDKLTCAPNLLIVEGPFDYMNARRISNQMGFDVVCTFKAEMSDRQLELALNTDKKLFCGYDHCPAGNKGYKSITERTKCARFRWEGVKDFGDMTDEQLISILGKVYE